jgi:hypothetical protein
MNAFTRGGSRSSNSSNSLHYTLYIPLMEIKRSISSFVKVKNIEIVLLAASFAAYTLRVINDRIIDGTKKLSARVPLLKWPK